MRSQEVEVVPVGREAMPAVLPPIPQVQRVVERRRGSWALLSQVLLVVRARLRVAPVQRERTPLCAMLCFLLAEVEALVVVFRIRRVEVAIRLLIPVALLEHPMLPKAQVAEAVVLVSPTEVPVGVQRVVPGRVPREAVEVVEEAARDPHGALVVTVVLAMSSCKSCKIKNP
jgi:hypothetical protein